MTVRLFTSETSTRLYCEYDDRFCRAKDYERDDKQMVDGNHSNSDKHVFGCVNVIIFKYIGTRHVPIYIA